MEWLVEFEGEQRPLESIWSDEAARIIGPLKEAIEKALEQATDPDDLKGLRVIVFAEETESGAEWGFKFLGPPEAVHYAVDLTGSTMQIVDPRH